MRQLAIDGLPEAGSLGALEAPILLSRAVELLGPRKHALQQLGQDAGLTPAEVMRVWEAAGGGGNPAVDLL